MAENEKKGRIPPNSKESEMMVLGCMLTNTNGLNIGADSLQEPDFYYTEHQIIFGSLKAAFCADKPADIHLGWQVAFDQQVVLAGDRIDLAHLLDRAQRIGCHVIGGAGGAFDHDEDGPHGESLSSEKTNSAGPSFAS